MTFEAQLHMHLPGAYKSRVTVKTPGTPCVSVLVYLTVPYQIREQIKAAERMAKIQNPSEGVTNITILRSEQNLTRCKSGHPGSIVWDTHPSYWLQLDSFQKDDTLQTRETV